MHPRWRKSKFILWSAKNYGRMQRKRHQRMDNRWSRASKSNLVDKETINVLCQQTDTDEVEIKEKKEEDSKGKVSHKMHWKY